MKRKYYLLFAGYCLLLVIIASGCGGGPGSPGSSGTENTGIMVDASSPVGSYNGATTNSVDAFQDQCGTPPSTTPEFFADHQATVTFTARLINPNATFQAGNLHIEKYTVTFTPSADSYGAPPIEFDPRYERIDISAPTGTGEVTVTTTLTLVDLIRKRQYANDILSGQYTPSDLNNYTAKFTFEGKNDFGTKFTFETVMNFQIGNFNNC